MLTTGDLPWKHWVEEGCSLDLVKVVQGEEVEPQENLEKRPECVEKNSTECWGEDEKLEYRLFCSERLN